MGRSESKQVVDQGTSQSAQNQQNAQASLAATNKSLGDYKTSLGNFLNFGRKTYGAGGEYQRDANTIANTTAAAGQTNLTGNLALNAMRTGQNTAGYAGTAAESQRQSSKDVAQELATSDQNRLGQLAGIEQFGVQASGLPASVQAGLYGTGTSGASGQLSAAGEAAKTPGFWDTFAPALAGAAGNVGAGFAKSCWIAAELYDGWYDPRTILVRNWLNTEFVKQPIGKIVMALYLRFGERVARVLHRHPALKQIFRPLFDKALKAARG